MPKCKWCEEPVAEGVEFCDDDCKAISDRHTAAQSKGGGPKGIQAKIKAGHRECTDQYFKELPRERRALEE